MKKHNPIVNVLVMASIVLQPTLTFAGDKEFKAHCKNKTFEQDDVKAACAQAKVAKNTRDLEATKVAVYTAATALTTAMAVIEDFPMTAAAARGLCLGLGIALPVATMAADIGVAVKNKNVASAAMGAMTSLASVATNVMGFKNSMSGVASRGVQQVSHATGSKAGEAASRATAQTGRGAEAANRATQSSSQASKSTNGAQQAACKSTAISMGISTAMSAIGLTMAQLAYNKSTNVASKLKETPGNQVALATDYNYNAGNSGSANVGGGRVPTSPSIDAVGVESCDSKSGNDYLKCMGTYDSDIAKISTSPEFMENMNKFLGQNLGDFAKNAPRDGDSAAMNNYVASALGMGSTGGDDISKMNKDYEKIAKDLDVMKYTPSYAGSGKSGSSSDSLDFNAMLAGMLKQTNPDAASAKNDEVAELAFRQMELLPAEKLMQNKDISLFARIGFRYRKAQPKLDSLNWTLPQNQQPNSENRAPAKN